MIPEDLLDTASNLYVYEIEGEISVESPALIGGWLEGEIVYLFFTSPQDDLVARAAEGCGARVLRRTVFPAKLWRPRVEMPLRVGRFIVVGPSHDEPVEPGAIEVRIKPGLVFGGGDHPTTRACLGALDALLYGFTPTEVLDVGTGTGILAIAAALAGASRVRAVDINPMAVDNALENVALNRVEARVEVVLGDGLGEIERGDLAFVNIPCSLIKRAASRLSGYSYVIAAGFLKGEAEQVLQALEGEGFGLLNRFEDEGWPGLLLKGPK